MIGGASVNGDGLWEGSGVAAGDRHGARIGKRGSHVKYFIS
jgi:hypothetical protein